MAELEPGLQRRIRASIRRQSLLTTMGVEIAEVADGRVVLDLPYRADLCQQNGYMHAGAVTAVVDSACGYAALTRMPDGRDVLTVEFKVNLVSPAQGDRFRAAGTVVRSGRTLTICSGEVTADGPGPPRLVALMQATMMAVTPPA